MKFRSFVAALAVGLSFGAYGVEPFTALQLPEGAHHPVLSPDGSTLLFSSASHEGLKALNINSGEISVIDNSAAAGFQPVFSNDGSTVYFRTAEMRDGLLYRDVRAFSFAKKSVNRIAPHSREDVDLASFSGGDFAVADYKIIRVRRCGKEIELNPIADSHSYLWASLSQDGSNLLFTEPFKGVFVANADGSNARQILRKGDNASWAGANTVIAVVSHDDGYVLLDSKLVAVDITTGKVTDLTDSSILVGEATAATDGTVVFSDINGNMFIFNIND